MDNTYREIDEAAECDVRLFWRLISRQKNRKTNQISEILHHNRQCKSPDDTSNVFADFYADVYTPTENAKFDKLVGTANISNIHTSNPSFADDVVCIGTSPQRLQILLNCAYDYSFEWRFEFNPLKSVILCYRNELDHVFNLGDTSVNVSTEMKHLGILRTIDLSPSKDIQHSCRKGRNAYFAIAGTGSCLLNSLTMCGLYNKIVMPAVLYGC
ncbi:unnamed protein product [Mytilus coruscus]|uniref:Reverse transcriptase domain-containing protein n=1 Tax=Mytilus coruscus TaxID=42192 RepID=A0A6J8DJI7_MYTCO|nr:unnamed protein product [Mytilus coruscus]